MLNNRLVQFREYNSLACETVATTLGISNELYTDYENGTQVPTIETVKALANFYKVTVSELYGFSPVLRLHDSAFDQLVDDAVTEKTLKMSDLSWDEKELLLYYRSLTDKESLMKKVIAKNFDDSPEPTINKIDPLANS